MGFRPRTMPSFTTAKRPKLPFRRPGFVAPPAASHYVDRMSGVEADPGCSETGSREIPNRERVHDDLQPTAGVSESAKIDAHRLSPVYRECSAYRLQFKRV